MLKNYPLFKKGPKTPLEIEKLKKIISVINLKGLFFGKLLVIVFSVIIEMFQEMSEVYTVKPLNSGLS